MRLLMVTTIVLSIVSYASGTFTPTDLSLYAPTQVEVGRGFWMDIVVDDTTPWITSTYAEVSAVKTMVIYDTTQFKFLGYFENTIWRQFDVVRIDNGIIFSASDPRVWEFNVIPMAYPKTPITFNLQFQALRIGGGTLNPHDSVVLAPGSDINTVVTTHGCKLNVVPEPSSVLLLGIGLLLFRLHR